jgi:hypothetical protein
MRFISNVVGSAIAGGKCESPTDVRAWTLAAQEALTALSEREPGSDDLDDSAELEQMASQAQSRQKGPTDPPW